MSPSLPRNQPASQMTPLANQINESRSPSRQRSIRISRRNVLRLAVIGATGAALGVLTGCGSSGPQPGEGAIVGEGGPNELFAETASFEIVANQPERLMVGLSTTDGRVLQGGTVRFQVYSTEQEAASFSVEAKYMAIPGRADGPAVATIGRPSQSIGVYVVPDVNFPKVGFWQIDIFDGNRKLATTAAEVIAAARVPDVGHAAPRTKNPIAADADVPRQQLDSLSGPSGLGDELNDPEFHNDRIIDLLDAGRPFVVIVATPAYCESKFCGPIVDESRRLAPKFPKVGFVHLEVWRDFEKREVSRHAAEWILPNGAEGREPWVFVVGADGTIVARFDNVVSMSELEAVLTDLS